MNQSYSDLLKDPRWQKKRLEVLSFHKFTCFFCGDTETTLHVHHFKYSGKPWEADDGDLAAICEDCHWLEHQHKYFTATEVELVDLIYRYNRPLSLHYVSDNAKEHIRRIKEMIAVIRASHG
jgi:hypothetical protein